MAEQQKHSPLPWKVKANLVYSNQDYLVAEGLSQVAHKDCLDAQFIVQACNSHKGLLQGCKDATYWLDFFDSDLPHNNSLTELKRILTEAIARAEKGS